MGCESTEIVLYNDEDIERVDLYCATLKALKSSKSYNKIVMPRLVANKILLSSLKGQSCTDSHLDISVRISLYNLAKESKSKDPYILQFIKETEESHHSAIC